MSERNGAITTGTAGPHEIDRLWAVDTWGFGQRMPDGVVEFLSKIQDPDRATVSRDASGEIVGTAITAPTRTTLPGSGRLPTAAVVGVSVVPTHRRQGRLRAMMRHQLDDIRSRGEALATLYASEGSIYGRYGYGPATFGARYKVDRRTVALTPEARALASGSVRMVSSAEALEAFPALTEECVRRRAGEIDPLPAEWLDIEGIGSPEEARQRFFAVYSEGDVIDGAVSYRVADIDQAEPWPNRAVHLERLVATTRAAYAALWDFVFGIDLVEEIRTRGRPTDEPVRWMLTDHRHLRTTGGGDRTWIRLVDAGRCLAGRSYSEEGFVTIELRDEFCPWNSGLYRLEAAGAAAAGASMWGGSVAVSVELIGAPGAGSPGREPDVTVDAAALASLLLGSVSWSVMAQAGRVVPRSSEVLDSLDRLFRTSEPPFCSSHF